MVLTETEIVQLIAKGENEEVDFKQELNLALASEKAEFIKDIISIANFKTDLGYLLIGVDTKSDVVGISYLEEERIQQIVHTYIDPSLIISCSLIYLNNPNTQVGVIEVKGNDKPYKVSQAIERLEKKLSLFDTDQ